MEEVNYQIKKQEDGWYLATADLDSGSIIIEGKDYASLKQRIIESIDDHSTFCRRENIPISKDLRIKLIHSEPLFNNPEAEKILITGSLENGGYRARTNTLLNLDLYHEDFDVLREQVIKEIQQQGHYDKHIEFRLEEVL